MFTYTHVHRMAVLSLGLIFLSSSPLNTFAADDAVDLQWAANTESDLAGYNVYHGTNSGVYGFPDNVQNSTSYHKGNLDSTKKHHFAITAYDNAGNESAPSAEVSTPSPSVCAPSTATVISSPSAGVTFSPGQTVTVQGQGSNLKWGIDRIGDGKPDFASGTGSTMSFTVPKDATTQQEIHIKLAGTNGNVQQVHKITSAPSALISLTAAHSNKCLEIPGSSQSNGAAATQSSCTGAANQQFQLKSVGTDTFQLIAKHSGKCLDIAGGSTANGARMQQYACHNGNNQRFRVTSSPATLVAVHSGKCIDVGGGSTSNGATVQQYACHGGLNQQWEQWESNQSLQTKQ